jgi:hypothetical protein
LRKLSGKSKVERIVFGSLSDAYPENHPVEGIDQVPVLSRRSITDIPTELVAFDDLKRARSQGDAGLHFFREDRKFISALLNPEAKIKGFAPYKIILTPDVTIGQGMPHWQRVRNVVLGRAAGVIWEKRGLKVIPTLRWVDEADLKLVACGVPQRSVFAVSSYMARRDPADYRIFQHGLRYLANYLNPVAVIVYGSLDAKLLLELSDQCDVFVFEHPMAKIRKTSKIAASNENALIPC